MRNAARLTGAAIVFALLGAWTALAANPQLENAQSLYERQDYVAAQKALSEIDRDDLAPDEQAEYDVLAEALPKAITGSMRAGADFSDAQLAFDEGRRADAVRLYQAVIDNIYAPPGQREMAREKIDRLENNQQLASAIQPAPRRTDPGVSEMQPINEPAPAPRSQPATSRPATTSPAPKPVNRQTTQGPGPRPMMQDAGPMQPMQPASPTATSTSTSTSPQMMPAGPTEPAPVRNALLDEMRATDNLLWGRAEAKLQELTRQTQDAVAAADFAEARRLAELARQIIEANRAYATPVSRYEVARQQADDLIDYVKQAEADYAVVQVREEADEIKRRLAERSAEIERQKAEKVEQLFNTAQRLRMDRRYREAAETIKQVLYIDPGNEKALYLRDIYEDFASFAEQRDVDRTQGSQYRATMDEGDSALIPWRADVLYPGNWLEIVERRDGIEQGFGRPDAEGELNAKLEEVMPDIDFVDQPFDQIMEFLSDVNKVNISIDWENLETAGVDRDRPVSIQLRDVSFGTVLNEVLSQVGGETPLGYNLGEGLIRIATKERLDRNKYILVYDIRDLLVNIPRFDNAPRIDLQQAGQQAAQAGQGGGGGGGQGLFQDDQEDDEDEGENQGLIDEIMDIIRQTVEPDSWRENGSGEGALRELNGQLIVYNTSDAHREIVDLLTQLRETRALQISVESRFLIVNQNFLEEIGVDLDFVFNQSNAGFDPVFNNQGTPLFDPFTGARVLTPRPFSRAGVFPAPPAAGIPFTPGAAAQPYTQAAFVPQQSAGWSFGQATPIGAQQGSLNLVDPTSINTGIPGSIAQGPGFVPALNIAGSYIDNIQIDFLIRATQANRRSAIVQAPRLMMFNGQRANVVINRTRSYVSSVTANVAEGAVGVQPIVAAIASGTVLDVEGTISADRKYVTLTVRTSLAQEPAFERFEVQRASGNSPGIFVLLPDQEIRRINTTVSVPDGGTVLLGGLKQVGEVEQEAGVPILSKIPVLKRAFTNTSEVKDTSTLLILLKAKILIQKEQEEEAFPTLATGL